MQSRTRSPTAHPHPKEAIIPAPRKTFPCGYSVILASLGDGPDETTPVGVVAWNSAEPWYGSRWLAADESIPGVDGTTRRFMRIVGAQIDRWADCRRVPYEPDPVEPTTDRFWKAVSKPPDSTRTTRDTARQPRWVGRLSRFDQLDT